MRFTPFIGSPFRTVADMSAAPFAISLEELYKSYKNGIIEILRSFCDYDYIMIVEESQDKNGKNFCTLN